MDPRSKEEFDPSLALGCLTGSCERNEEEEVAEIPGLRGVGVSRETDLHSVLPVCHALF